MRSLPLSVEEVCSAFLREVDARLPRRLDALLLRGSLCWGEFFPGSDIDFVAVWDEVPDGSELGNLRAAHEATRAAHPGRDFDGFHCTAADLVRPPAVLGPRPVFFHGSFDPAGSSDLNLVTWHELAERGVVVRGSVPSAYTEVEELVRFTRENLDTYWRGQLRQVVDAGVEVVGANDAAVAWLVLGAPRLHHVLTRRTLTSKSGAGRYVLDSLDARWHRVAKEALRIREHPDQPSLYDDPRGRGQDVRDLLAWILDDALGPGVQAAGS